MIPFAKDTNPPAGADWGFCFRTGKRGNYTYWYKDDRTDKYYEGHKPSPYWINHSTKQRKRRPPVNLITENPWRNYNKSNPEVIETVDKPVVLMNYYGITNSDEIELHEDQGYITTINELLKIIKVDQQFTINLVVNIHLSIFRRIYPWAGKYRTVNIAKPNFRWPPHIYIEREMEDYNKEILKKLTPARYKDTRIFEDAAKVAGELLMIHPFREGNGRVAKLLASLLILQAGFPIPNMQKVKKAELISAALEAYSKNYQPLTKILQA